MCRISPKSRQQNIIELTYKKLHVITIHRVLYRLRILVFVFYITLKQAGLGTLHEMLACLILQIQFPEKPHPATGFNSMHVTFP